LTHLWKICETLPASCTREVRNNSQLAGLMTLTLLAGIYLLRTLCTLVSLERFPKPAPKTIFPRLLANRTIEPPVHSILGVNN
jgi:hypothetical protein